MTSTCKAYLKVARGQRLRTFLLGVLPSVLALTVTQPLSARPAPPASEQTLSAAAAKEGQVSLYLQGPPIFDALIARFQAKYPKVRIVKTGGRYELTEKIDAQIKTGKLEADVVVVQTILDFERWNAAGNLLKFKPEGFDAIVPQFKDAQGGYLAFAYFLSGIGYNEATVPASAAPRSVRDFVEPRFRNQIASTYPHDDDLTLWRYSQIVDRYGWPFVEQLLAQSISFSRSHYALGNVIAEGKHPVTFDQFSVMSKNRFAAPADLPLLAIPMTVAILDRSPNPNAARLLVSFLVSQEAQALMTTQKFYPSRRDAKVTDEMRALLSRPVDYSYAAFMRDGAKVARLRARFRQLIGEPRGDYNRAIQPKDK